LKKSWKISSRLLNLFGVVLSVLTFLCDDVADCVSLQGDALDEGSDAHSVSSAHDVCAFFQQIPRRIRLRGREKKQIQQEKENNIPIMIVSWSKNEIKVSEP
jgi:hypothetical protein